MHRHRGATGASAYTVSTGYRKRGGERKKRREREEEERWEGSFYTLNNTYLPKMGTFPLHTACHTEMCAIIIYDYI